MIASAIIFLSIMAVFTYFIFTRNDENENALPGSVSNVKENILALESQTNEEGGLSITVKPVNFSLGKEIRFEVSFNTHQGDLAFDLTRQAVLTDDRNNRYAPLGWQGGTGGHHISGTLAFPAIPSGAKSMKLVIGDIYGIKERIFEWPL